MAKPKRAERKEAPPQVEAKKPLKREKPESGTPDTSVEAKKIGDKTEFTGGFGNKIEATFAGSTTMEDGRTLEIYSTNTEKGNDATHLMVWRTPEESAARAEAAPKVERQANSFDNALESALTAAGLSGDAWEAKKAELMGRKAEIIADAMGEKDPEKAMVSGMQEAVAAKEAYTGPSLEEASAAVRAARKKVEGAKNDKQYEEAMTALYAAEAAQTEARLALNPDASEEQKTRIALESEGAVTPATDPLYEQGADAVKARMKELGKKMDAADKAENEVAWMAAREEYDRHQVMLPTVEAIGEMDAAMEELRNAPKEVADRIEAAESDLAAKKKKGVRSNESIVSYWQKKAQALGEAAAKFDIGLAGTQEGFEEDDDELAERQKAFKKYEEALGKIEQFQKRADAWKEQKVEWDRDPNEMIDNAQSALYNKLTDLHKEMPDAVRAYVEKAIKDKDTPESNLVILQAFSNDVMNSEIPHMENTPPVVPGSNLERAYNKMMENQGTVKVKVRESSEYQQALKFMSDYGGVESLKKYMNRKENPVAFREAAAQLVSDIESGAIDIERAHNEDAAMDAFEAKGEEIALSQEERAEYADLIKAGVIEDGADMAGWENSYQELAAGLEAEGLGRSMEDMGLPSSFSELKNMKDDRKGVKGFFSKLFRRPSPRAKAFETLAKAHYEVMSLGKTDVSDKLAAMKQRQEEHARKMTRAGRK